MKQLLLPAVLCILVGSPACQPVRQNTGLSAPTIDERIELMSIAARLAEYDEYNTDINKRYVATLHQYFDQFKEHPLISYMRSVRNSNSIYFDAVMNMAVNLSPPPGLLPLAPFSADIPDSRWGADSAMKLAVLLRQFYNDTNFDRWFRQNASLYQQATDEFGKVCSKLDVPWYFHFYGTEPKAEFKVVLGMANGEISYGPKVTQSDGKETYYAIMGVSTFDSSGKPVFNVNDFLPSLIHEFNHSFTDDLIDKYKPLFGSAGDTIFSIAGPKIHQPPYGEWPVMVSEALDRASVIRYLMRHETESVAKKELADQMAIGFIWLDKLVDLLGVYESHRKTYSALDSFMPKMADFYKKIAGNYRALQANYERLQPHVTSIEQFTNGQSGVNPKLSIITIHFDKPLLPGKVSLNYGTGGVEHFPITSFQGFGPDKTSISLEIKLRPNSEYQFVLPWLYFKTADGHHLDEYEIDFKTAK